MTKSLGLGAVAALFFASTFVLNRVLALHGASVLWLSGLRYLFTVPMLMLVVVARREWRPVWGELLAHPGPWLLWGTVGFGLFYLPLTWVAAWAPAWLVAGSWQMTIVMGSLLVPFIEPSRSDRQIPLNDLWPTLIILAGVALTEWFSHRSADPLALLALVPMTLAAVAYPLGNRQMMRYTRLNLSRWSVYQRTLGMTMGSMPFWLLVMAGGFVHQGLPGSRLVVGTLAIALFSGVVATLFFFAATDQAQGNTQWLARIEATQALEILFTVLLAGLLFNQHWPRWDADLGLIVIATGMVWHSLRKPSELRTSRKDNVATWSE